MTTLTTADFRKLSDQARQQVQRIHDDTARQVTLPDVERQDLEQYNALTDREHATIYRQVGADRYQEYVDTMERLKKRYQPQGV